MLPLSPAQFLCQWDNPIKPRPRCHGITTLSRKPRPRCHGITTLPSSPAPVAMAPRRSGRALMAAEGPQPGPDTSLVSLYRWLDTVPLSRPRRNIARDFSDGGWSCGDTARWPGRAMSPAVPPAACPRCPRSAGGRGGEILLPLHGGAAQLCAHELHGAESRQLGPPQQVGTGATSSVWPQSHRGVLRVGIGVPPCPPPACPPGFP